MVITNGDQVTTVLVRVEGKVIPEIVLPPEKVSSVVETEGDVTAMVGGLNKVAASLTDLGDANSVKLTMMVKAVPASGTDAAQTAITALVDQQEETVEFLDMSVFLQYFGGTKDKQTEAIHAVDTVMELIIPYDTATRQNIQVFRYHDDGENTPEALKFTKLSVRSDDNYTDGTYFVGDGFIVVYADKFSEYAVGYTTDTDDSNRGLYGLLLYPLLHRHKGNDTAVAPATDTTITDGEVESANTGDMGVVLYGVLTVTSLLGMGWVGKKKHDMD